MIVRITTVTKTHKAMAKKQFKIGECAVGGIIAVECTKERIIVNVLDFYTKKQALAPLSLAYAGSNAYDNTLIENHIDNYLNEITTYYYAEKIMNWIKSNVKL